MKKLLLSFVLLMGVLSSANAQIVKGDMNNDGKLTMPDANAVVNAYVNETEPQTIDAVTHAELNALKEEVALLKKLLCKYDPAIFPHEYVDLGLSVKWATCNVGATAPEEYGDYFAWGEVEPKSDYSWSTYKWCNGSDDTQTKYCTLSSYGKVDNKKVLDLDDDAAHVNWGDDWRMPTYDELEELYTRCAWTWTTQNGVYGRKVTGLNGNSIFLPAAGCRDGASLRSAGSWGSYWSSSLYTNYSCHAYELNFGSDNNVYWGSYYRQCGQSVRPVCP